MERLIFGAIAVVSISLLAVIVNFVASKLTRTYKSFRRGSQFVATAKTAEEIQTGDTF